jgi:hypothetical protein
VSLPWFAWRLVWGLEDRLVSMASILAGVADAPARLWHIGWALGAAALSVSRWNLLWVLFVGATGLVVAKGPRPVVSCTWVSRGRDSAPTAWCTSSPHSTSPGWLGRRWSGYCCTSPR